MFWRLVHAGKVSFIGMFPAGGVTQEQITENPFSRKSLEEHLLLGEGVVRDYSSAAALKSEEDASTDASVSALA
jgi:hypothetical protein